MPESQFGNTPGSLEATLDELVALARGLRAQPALIPSRLTRLEGLTQMLGYFVAPVGLRSPTEINEHWPIALTTHCAFDACTRTWRDADACLLNFARRGEPALWLCRDHHPPPSDGGIRPPGWQPPLTERDKLEADRKAAMALLSKDQLRLVNGRMQGA